MQRPPSACEAPAPSSRSQVSVPARVALVLFGICVGLALVELALRVTMPTPTYHFPSSRITDDRFATRAGQAFDGNGVRYAFDPEGFRQSRATAAAGARSVLFIGDSFTQGFGVNDDETFPAVTCERLGQRGIAARCLNAGVSGFGTAHELRLLRALLRRQALTVDAVVFQVLPNNDLRDNWEDGGFGVEGGRLVAREPPRVPMAVWLRDVLFDNALARGSRLVTVAANACFNGEGMDPHYDAAAFEVERQLLQAVVATVQQRRIPLVMLIVATAAEVDAVRTQPYDEHARLDFVARVVQQLSVPWIDSRTVARRPADYRPDDGHFSVAGNAVIGGELAERLTPLLR